MPLTSDQQALSDILANYNYYINPTVQGSAPSSGGWTQPNNGPRTMGDMDYGLGSLATGGVTGAVDAFREGNAGLGILDILSGGAGGIIRNLLKKDKKPSWTPYENQGMYYFNDPKISNPVPLSGIPGAGMVPSLEYQQMANNVRAVQDLLPYFANAISAQKIPDAMGQLAADTATTGPRLALQQALQEQYGPIFDKLNAESNLRRSMYGAANDASVLAGPGKQLIEQALAAAKLYDPEYFATRTATSDSIGKLLANTTANLGKGLTNTERDEVSRGLALSNDRAGTTNAPSQLNTVGNAMAFGQAGRQRETESQNQLSKAIAASTAFLPTAKSNVDVFQVATGKPSYAQNDTRFNTNTANSDQSGNANSLLNTSTSMWTTNQNNALQEKLAKGDWTDILSSVTGALGSVGGLVGLCWIAREIYGEDNPKWKQFRTWLIRKAPYWLFDWYHNNGEEFARYIHNKPLLKFIIRKWMDGRIKSYAN